MLRARYPRLSIYGVIGDFRRHLGALPSDGRRMVAFLGSTIGNLGPGQRGRFLRDLESSLWTCDWLLLGTDLVKDPGELVAAYEHQAAASTGTSRSCGSFLLIPFHDEMSPTTVAGYGERACRR